MPSRRPRACAAAGVGAPGQAQLRVRGADGGEQAGVRRGAVSGLAGGTRRGRGSGGGDRARSSSIGTRSWLISWSPRSDAGGQWLAQPVQRLAQHATRVAVSTAIAAVPVTDLLLREREQRGEVLPLV